MSNASGLGVLDLAILEACERAGARNDGPYVKTQRVLEDTHRLDRHRPSTRV